jgi:hypothetical protein
MYLCICLHVCFIASPINRLCSRVYQQVRCQLKHTGMSPVD